MVPGGIAQRSCPPEPMGSISPVAARPDAEVAQRTRGRAPGRADPLDERAGRTALHRLEQGLEIAPLPLCHAADRSVRFVGDPARQSEFHAAVAEEIAKTHTLDP